MMQAILFPIGCAIAVPVMIFAWLVRIVEGRA